jgi:hypothetical protein
MTSVKIVLGLGLALIVIAVIATLSRAPLTLAGTNSVRPKSILGRTTGTRYAYACQAGESLPRDTSAVRLSLFAVIGPKVTISVWLGPRQITSGTRPPGWVGSVVTIPLEPVSDAHSAVKLCFRLTSINGPIQVIGEDTPPAEAAVSNGEPLAGRIRVEYLRPSTLSWLSLTSSITYRMGFGHAASGAWDILLVIVLAAAVVTLSTLLAVRGL